MYVNSFGAAFVCVSIGLSNAVFAADLPIEKIGNLGACNDGQRHITFEEASTGKKRSTDPNDPGYVGDPGICSHLATWDIARLAGGGSMGGPGYQCSTFQDDSRGMGAALCTKIDIALTDVKVVDNNSGDCAEGQRLLTYNEAQDLLKKGNGLCDMLANNAVARLHGEKSDASLSGKDHNCHFQEASTQTSLGFGAALCVNLN
ncbi:hypothetical protein NBRC116594_23240 [Shimia sp. NS0008-38b]